MSTQGSATRKNKKFKKTWILVASTIALSSVYYTFLVGLKVSDSLASTTTTDSKKPISRNSVSLPVSMQAKDVSINPKKIESIKESNNEAQSSISETPEKIQVTKNVFSALIGHERSHTVKENIPAIEYEVETQETDYGFKVKLNRSQLWKTNWVNTLGSIHPTLAFKEGKIIGVTLNNVEEKGLLESVGIQKKDTITKINGKDLNNPLTIPEIVASGVGARETELVLEREGKPVTMKISSDSSKMADMTQEEKDKVVREYQEFASATSELASVNEDTKENQENLNEEDTKKLEEAKAKNPLVDALLEYSMSVVEGTK